MIFISNSKRKSTKNKRLDEFKKKKTKPGKGHPAYIYQKIGDNYVYVGITHSSITNDTKNIRLEKNPNPNDNRNAYFIPKPSKEKISNFGRKYTNWTINDNYKKKIKNLKK